MFASDTLLSRLSISCTIILAWEIFVLRLYFRVSMISQSSQNKVLANKMCFTEYVFRTPTLLPKTTNACHVCTSCSVVIKHYAKLFVISKISQKINKYMYHEKLWYLNAKTTGWSFMSIVFIKSYCAKLIWLFKFTMYKRPLENYISKTYKTGKIEHHFYFCLAHITV